MCVYERMRVCVCVCVCCVRACVFVHTRTHTHTPTTLFQDLQTPRRSPTSCRGLSCSSEECLEGSADNSYSEECFRVYLGVQGFGSVVWQVGSVFQDGLRCWVRGLGFETFFSHLYTGGSVVTASWNSR